MAQFIHERKMAIVVPKNRYITTDVTIISDVEYRMKSTVCHKRARVHTANAKGHTFSVKNENVENNSNVLMSDPLRTTQTMFNRFHAAKICEFRAPWYCGLLEYTSTHQRVHAVFAIILTPKVDVMPNELWNSTQGLLPCSTDVCCQQGEKSMSTRDNKLTKQM